MSTFLPLWYLTLTSRVHATNPSLPTYRSLQEYLQYEPADERLAEQQFIDNSYASKHGAFCLDGSIPDYYYRPGLDDGTRKFQIYLQGGGWCQNIENCVNRSTFYLGSSAYDQKYFNLNSEPGAPYLSSQSSVNPLTYNWNTVFVRYCDGTSFASNNETVFEYNATTRLWFRGWRILNGVLNDLVQKYELAKATDVLLSGCSAGGLSVFFHNNYVYDLLMQFQHAQSLKYMAMVDAGYFMEVSHFISEMTFVYDIGNVTDALNQDCLAYYNQSENGGDLMQCMYAVNVAPFIKTKMFSLQSQYDMIQIERTNISGNITAINAYGRNLTDWYLQRYIDSSQQHFGWLVSCYQHCTQDPNEIWNKIVIDGITVSEAQINEWYGNVTYGQLLFQNETYPCNNSCGENNTSLAL